jgi:hypothetical protein
MGSRQAAVVGLLLSLSSCVVGVGIAPQEQATTAPAAASARKVASAVAPARPAPKAHPLQDPVDALPKRLEQDPDHPSVTVVRHIEQTLDLWDALDRCRRDPGFRHYGIMPGGPCGNLAEVASALRDDPAEKQVYEIGLQCSAGDVSEAAIDYVELSGRRDPEEVKYVSWVRGRIEECRRKLPQIEPKVEVSRASMGDAWPLTVESGTVGCDYRHRIWFQPRGSSVRYAVNGSAKAKFRDIKPIWARDLGYPDTSDGIIMRKMMTPLIDAGQGLC